MLGGSFLLRGYPEDRFIDRQAWTVDLEQRIRLFQTHVRGGGGLAHGPVRQRRQVFDTFSRAFSHPRVAAGVGLRAFVHPNVLGRIDLARGSEGLKVYVELGYPY